ncbi:MAG: GntR family transcriptional regulator [Clostridia bacterium]|nr:GntR family transcriptional regulator [Clostridia bacterium]MBQ7046647.1 GntR family transcriptional regulator [Oscillospiraceae bacterium]
MINIDKQSRVPAYEQIKNQLMTLILVGTFPPHSQLPSIRSITASAGLNINTVKKAFSDLESYGVIYTVPGKGSFVSEKAFSNDTVKQSALSDISSAVETARAKGIRKQEIIEILNKIYTEEETEQ